MSDDEFDATAAKPFSFPEGFADAYYLISVTPDKFNADEFWRALKARGRTFESGHAVFAPEARSSHFAVLSWFEGETGELNFRIDYERGSLGASGKPLTNPSAERLVGWLGKFFKYDTAQSHLHARFRYPLDERRSRYPLPVRTAFGDADETYEIYGVLVRIPSRPRGVTSVQLSRGKSQWSIEIIANKRMTFRAFSPDGDIRSIHQVVDNFLEMKQ